ncbi:hypothetical protein LCGC14_3099040, partial [marine sediment metagenome]
DPADVFYKPTDCNRWDSPPRSAVRGRFSSYPVGILT